MTEFVVVEPADTLRKGDRVLVPTGVCGTWMVLKDDLTGVKMAELGMKYTGTQMHLRVHPVGDDRDTYFWGPQRGEHVRIIRRA